MKKILPILLLLILLFGCAEVAHEQQKDTSDAKKSPTVKVEETVEAPAKSSEELNAAKTTEKTTEKTAETENEKTETDETTPSGKSESINETSDEETMTLKKPKLELTGELKELLSKIDKKVKNYKYTYGPPPLTTEINTYSVQLKNSRGEDEFLIRVSLYEYEPTKLEDYWDTVFLNPATKEAKIYCLDKTKCQSKEIDKTNQTKTGNYTDYAVKTPDEWAKDIPANAKLIGPEILDKKAVTKFEYTGPGGEKFYVWLDNTYGLPQKVTIEQLDGKKINYLFKDMKVNSETDEDFKPPF